MQVSISGVMRWMDWSVHLWNKFPIRGNPGGEMGQTHTWMNMIIYWWVKYPWMISFHGWGTTSNYIWLMFDLPGTFVMHAWNTHFFSSFYPRLWYCTWTYSIHTIGYRKSQTGVCFTLKRWVRSRVEKLLKSFVSKTGGNTSIIRKFWGLRLFRMIIV